MGRSPSTSDMMSLMSEGLGNGLLSGELIVVDDVERPERTGPA